MSRPLHARSGLLRTLLGGPLSVIAAGLIVSAGSAGAAPGAAGLKSHRAVYSIRLAEDGESRDFARAQGRFVLEWQKSCAGATLNQRLVTEFIPFEGETLLSDLRFSSWEAADGSTLRFSLSNLLNGALSEMAEGTADLGKGAVTFSKPSGKTMDLPGGTVFPTTLTAQLVEAARGGESTLSRIIYDGAEDGKAMKGTAFIGAEKSAKGAEAFTDVDGGGTLASLPYWPVTVGYFERDGSKDLPEYQVSFHLYPNGISDSLTLDYVDFRLKADLTELTLLETPACP